MAGIKYWLWLSECKGLPTGMKLRLLQHFGDPENIWYAERDDLLLAEGMTPRFGRALGQEHRGGGPHPRRM